LFSHSFHNDDLLPKVRKPMLITHGAGYAIVKPAVINQHRGASLKRKFTE
jgi:non-heme chloroperoxidase